MEIDELYRRTLTSWTDRVRALGDSADWAATTPCTDWSVRDLVNHVVGEDRWTGPLVEGRTIADVGDSLDGDLLGDDPVAAALGAADEAATAVDASDRATVQLSYGEEATAEYLHQLAADHLVHGWDLAVATGGDTRLDPELVTAVGTWFAEREELYRSAGAIGPRVEAVGDAQVDLLAGFGRDAGWVRA